MRKINFLYVGMSLLTISFTMFYNIKPNVENEKNTIHSLLDQWHAAAAKADHATYFGMLSADSHYIGTDATENWDKKAFDAFAKPYFEKGRAWDFKAVERNIYFSKDGKVAWFDELLDTWMKGCRGSGVLEKEGKTWKIKHYVLSMTVPNEVTDKVLPYKAQYEDAVIEKLKSGKN
ncbi:nuclear transport factor 2 family protein [Flavobacterium sp. J372]|uniref:nuclear transport factor 2 family protein n=1 Tax=Flavobacterium sp. J372 TaxID=2898436 RepID=UPI002150E16A|nr:nuclear transport factor 2 family protein [Flavobacterium sp. J372]MCR5861028.1 nuclear transport factor 2 family protein [Flavobacterium sp. J372]